MGKYRIMLRFWSICQNFQILWHFEFFVNRGPHGTGNFKTLLLQFSPDLSQTVLGHWLSWRNAGSYFPWQSAKFFFKKNGHLKIWHWSQWEKPWMCNILKAADRNGWKSGGRGPISCICTCRVLFMPDSLISVWGHSVHFANFTLLRFSTGYSSHSSHTISTKLYSFMEGMVIRGVEGLLRFSGHLPNLKTYGTLTMSPQLHCHYYLFIVIYLDWVGQLQFNMFSTLVPSILKQQWWTIWTKVQYEQYVYVLSLYRCLKDIIVLQNLIALSNSFHATAPW